MYSNNITYIPLDMHGWITSTDQLGQEFEFTRPKRVETQIYGAYGGAGVEKWEKWEIKR